MPAAWRARAWTETGAVEAVDIRERLAAFLSDSKGLLWLDMEDAAPEETALLTEVFHLDPLIVEDCVSEVHHPKADAHPDLVFIAVHGVPADSPRGEVHTLELDVVLSERYLITYRQDPMRSIASVSPG